MVVQRYNTHGEAAMVEIEAVMIGCEATMISCETTMEGCETAMLRRILSEFCGIIALCHFCRYIRRFSVLPFWMSPFLSGLVLVMVASQARDIALVLGPGLLA